MTRRILILGGTGEAVALAERLHSTPGIDVVSSLAGRTRAPNRPQGDMRVGGFGGAEGLARYLREARIDAVIDATHPFAARISTHAATACDTTAIPYLLLLRPPWIRQTGDRWAEVDDVSAAADALAATAKRALVTVGRQELHAFARLRHIHLVVRLVEPPSEPLPLADCELIVGRGPFSVADERQLLTKHRIDTVVSKNSGGESTRAKIVAARELGLAVVMVRRPAKRAGAVFGSVEDALKWVSATLA
ncbi:MAG TPA: cobalt-precorrin-6A reductase [Stellaceae bacterium]|nr:cobalt-precorrin-6A reductase [Stellaceae bacterium]